MKRNTPEYTQIPAFPKILDDLSVGNNVFLVGSAGTGKTTLAEKVAYAFFDRDPNDGKDAPFLTINCNQWTSPIDLKGGQTMEGYKEGALIEAWRDGKILILDELPKLDPNTAGILNDALAKSKKDKALIFNGRNDAIEKHPQFGCIASGNTFGKGHSHKYIGNNQQDASLLDRFSSCVYYIGFNKQLEKQLIYPDLLALCWNIRDAILSYEGKDAEDSDTDDLMTLRTMLNLQSAYLLEMVRETGVEHEKKRPTIEDFPNGKTLKDGLESFFLVMNKDKARQIKTELDIEAFYNSYTGVNHKLNFVEEYVKRNGAVSG